MSIPIRTDCWTHEMGEGWLVLYYDVYMNPVGVNLSKSHYCKRPLLYCHSGHTVEQPISAEISLPVYSTAPAIYLPDLHPHLTMFSAFREPCNFSRIEAKTVDYYIVTSYEHIMPKYLKKSTNFVLSKNLQQNSSLLPEIWP